MFPSCFYVYHTEKKGEGEREHRLSPARSKPIAPIFLQGLSDLKVMDGSQVTMTVQVSGLSR
jgi:myosin-light-chain kinase